MARPKSERKKKGKSAAFPKVTRNVVPDRLDLRDRPYQPPVGVIPGKTLNPKLTIPVLNQGETSACTGFALSTVVYHLQSAAKRPPSEWDVSPFMLYSMARRYDEFPGDKNADTGSSLRAAMKGWYKHGACKQKLWTTIEMPEDKIDTPADDWWLDAVRRPLGAYYRVDSRSITDMHVALQDVGILYASAECHSGWDQGFDKKPKGRSGYWVIPAMKIKPEDSGHAFAIIGYTDQGFIVQNSWGKGWGTGGRAILTYNDWLDHAMDCWVAQIGVVTDLHVEIAQSKSIRVVNKRVELATESRLRAREISPFIINMENNGRLSNTGDFRTQLSDVTALVNDHLGAARETWGLRTSDPVDIAIYAHGGLTSEGSAAETAAEWIKILYQNKIFPIFFMWETDLWSTLKNRFFDKLAEQEKPTGGLISTISDWWDKRLERFLSVPGTAIWAEMKQNADAISSHEAGGGIILYEASKSSKYFSDPSKVRLHLIGHSAGAIVHSHIIKRLGGKGWTFQSVNFMAPAVRLDVFQNDALAAIKNKTVKYYNQFHLTDDMEQKDSTCRPILGYGQSLLYLVSKSFEKGEPTPILGMEKFFKEKMASLKLPNVRAFSSPTMESKSTTHGGFDDDSLTRESIIKLIKGKAH